MRIDKAHKASIEKRKAANAKKQQKTSITHESVSIAEESYTNIWTDPNVKNLAGIVMLEFITDYIQHERKNAMEAFLNTREGHDRHTTVLRTQNDRKEAVRLAEAVKKSRDDAQEVLDRVINRPRKFD